MFCGGNVISRLAGGFLAGILLFSVSCTRDENFTYKRQGSGVSYTQSVNPVPLERSVMLLYSAGYNSLASYLASDIEDLDKGFIPKEFSIFEGKDGNGGHGGSMGEHVLLVYSRNAGDDGRSFLFRISLDLEGEVVKDTLKVWGTDVNSASSSTMREVLNLVHDSFPAKSYGMVFSSHASGWLPPGYYNNPSNFERGASSYRSSAAGRRTPEVFPPLGNTVPVKSFGQDHYKDLSVEMEMKDFADGIPFRLDYLLIDACLSGCVEVAWQLRGKADVVGFSQAEVLATGFDYTTITTHLLQNTPDPVAVCRDYFDFYDSKTSESQRSATISVVDTRRMESLASVCAELFETYRTQLSEMNWMQVQGYYRYKRHFFFDLRDMLVKAGATAEELDRFDAALEECMLYKAATPWFLKGLGTDESFQIKTACGLSTYLPSGGTDYLDSYYKANVAWNDVTQLVK